MVKIWPQGNKDGLGQCRKFFLGKTLEKWELSLPPPKKYFRRLQIVRSNIGAGVSALHVVAADVVKLVLLVEL